MELYQDVQMKDVVEDVSPNVIEPKGFNQYGELPRTIPGELPAKSLDQLDAWIETLSQCTPLAESDVEALCNMVSTLFLFISFGYSQAHSPLTIATRQKAFLN